MQVTLFSWSTTLQVPTLLGKTGGTGVGLAVVALVGIDVVVGFSVVVVGSSVVEVGSIVVGASVVGASVVGAVELCLVVFFSIGNSLVVRVSVLLGAAVFPSSADITP